MLGLNKVRFLGFHYLSSLSLTFFLVFPTLSWSSLIQSQERPEFYFEDLASALRGFEENASTLVVENYDVDIADANLDLAKSEKGFRVGLNISGQSVYEDRPNEAFYHHYRTFNQVYVRKPLFHWGALKSKEKIAFLLKEQAENHLFYRKRAIKGQIRAVFLEMVVLKYKILVTSEQIKLAQENSDIIREKLDLGLYSPIQLDESISNHLRLKISQSQHETKFSEKSSLFTRLSGFKYRSELDIPNKFWNFVLNEKIQKDLPIQIGKLNASELNNLRAQLSIESENVRIAEAELKPKINFMTAYYQDQIDLANSGQSIDRNNFVAGIEANWALWDSHQSKSQKKAALARKSKVDHLINLKIRELNDYGDSLRKELLSLMDRIELSRKLLTLSEKRLEKGSIELNLNRINRSQHFSLVLALNEAKLMNLEVVSRYLILLDQYDLLINSVTSYETLK